MPKADNRTLINTQTMAMTNSVPNSLFCSFSLFSELEAVIYAAIIKPPPVDAGLNAADIAPVMTTLANSLNPAAPVPKECTMGESVGIIVGITTLAEIAFYSKPQTTNPLIEYENLMQEELLICTKKGHPLGALAEPNPGSKYPILNPSLLENELLIQMMPEQRTRQITDHLFKERGWKFKNKMSTSSLPAIMELVCKGYGISFIFETHLRHHKFSQPIDCFSIQTPPLLSDFVVAFRKGAYLSSYTLAFVEIAKDFLMSEQTCKQMK